MGTFLYPVQTFPLVLRYPVCVAVNHYQKFQNIFPEASRVQNKFYLNAPVGGEFVEYEQIDTSHIRKNQSKQWFAYK